jgi:hypothetical protein
VKKLSGFFVKLPITLSYIGPFNYLAEARTEARKIGPNLEIYGGDLIINDDETQDAKDLYLIPKMPKRI